MVSYVRNFKRSVTKVAPHEALKLITCGKLTFDEMFVVHLVDWGKLALRALQGRRQVFCLPGHTPSQTMDLEGFVRSKLVTQREWHVKLRRFACDRYCENAYARVLAGHETLTNNQRVSDTLAAAEIACFPLRCG